MIRITPLDLGTSSKPVHVRTDWRGRFVIRLPIVIAQKTKTYRFESEGFAPVEAAIRYGQRDDQGRLRGSVIVRFAAKGCGWKQGCGGGSKTKGDCPVPK